MDEDKNIRKFLNKKSLLERRLKNEILEDGIAYIPCHIENMEDIISRYSVRGCEGLAEVSRLHREYNTEHLKVHTMKIFMDGTQKIHTAYSRAGRF